MKNTDVKREIGRAILNVRKCRNLSKADVARLMDIPYTTYDSYERGYREPDIETIQKIAAALDVNWWELLGLKFDGRTAEGDSIFLGPDTDSEGTQHFPDDMFERNKKAQEIEKRIIDSLSVLNLLGQEQVASFAEFLVQNERYRKPQWEPKAFAYFPNVASSDEKEEKDQHNTDDDSQQEIQNQNNAEDDPQ